MLALGLSLDSCIFSLLSLLSTACLSFPSPGGSSHPETVWGLLSKAGLGSGVGSYISGSSILLPVGMGMCCSPHISHRLFPP